MTSLKQQIRSIEGTVEKLKKESKGKHFTSITSGEIKRRLKLASDPFITTISYDGHASPGGKIETRVWNLQRHRCIDDVPSPLGRFGHDRSLRRPNTAECRYALPPPGGLLQLYRTAGSKIDLTNPKHG